MVLIDDGNGKDLEFMHDDYVTGSGRFGTHSQNMKERYVNPELTVEERRKKSKRDSARRNQNFISLYCENNVQIEGFVQYNPATTALYFSWCIRGKNGKKVGRVN